MSRTMVIKLRITLRSMIFFQLSHGWRWWWRFFLLRSGKWTNIHRKSALIWYDWETLCYQQAEKSSINIGAPCYCPPQKRWFLMSSWWLRRFVWLRCHRFSSHMHRPLVHIGSRRPLKSGCGKCWEESDEIGGGYTVFSKSLVSPL